MSKLATCPACTTKGRGVILSFLHSPFLSKPSDRFLTLFTPSHSQQTQQSASISPPTSLSYAVGRREEAIAAARQVIVSPIFLAFQSPGTRSLIWAPGAPSRRRRSAATRSDRRSTHCRLLRPEPLRHQYRAEFLSKTPQESPRSVQRGRRSTTVLFGSDRAPPRLLLCIRSSCPRVAAGFAVSPEFPVVAEASPTSPTPFSCVGEHQEGLRAGASNRSSRHTQQKVSGYTTL
uniref:Uncharacterized protein n=1 Tax=Leersia perrieri TaxID=77586 RepID=A0A0D9W387_9ORYZ